MADWFGDIVADGGDSEYSVLISFLGDVSEPILVGVAQIVIGSHFVVSSFSLDALAGSPLVGLHPHTEDMLGLELFLPQIHRFCQLVVLAVEVIVEVALHEDSLGDGFVVGLGG